MPIADHISNVSDVTLQAPGLFSQLATGRFWPKAACHSVDILTI